MGGVVSVFPFSVHSTTNAPFNYVAAGKWSFWCNLEVQLNSNYTHHLCRWRMINFFDIIGALITIRGLLPGKFRD